jgi:hypothetical protein
MRAPSPHKNDSTSVAFLLSTSTTFNCISWVLTKHNIKTVGLPPKTLSSLVQPIEDDLTLKTPVYSIPREWGKVCIGQTRPSIEM